MNQNNNREVVEISVEDIIPNRFQPRLTFDPEALNDLASSIKEHGIIQPLVVRRLQDKFEIIAGERRYKAASLIGLSTVPCIIMNLNDNESAEVAIIENIQRKEMTPLEEAKSFKKLLDKGYLTQDELAKRMGKSQSNISNKLRLLNLDEVVQEAILNGKISERHARSLLRVDNKDEQRNILAEIIEKRLTVKQTDELIKEKIGDNSMENHIENGNNNIINNIFKEEPSNNTQVSNPVQNMNLSTPTVKLPIDDSIEPNPQTNIISQIKEPAEPIAQVNTTPNYGAPSPKESLNIFRFDTQVPQNTEQELKNIISPSVFSNEDTNPNTNNNVSSNINTSSIFTNTNEQSNIFKPVENNSISNLDSIVTLQDNQIINQDTQNNNLDSIFTNNNNSINLDINNIKNNAESINQPEKPNVDMNDLLKSTDKPANKFFVDLDIDPNQLNKLTLEPKIQNSVNTINRCIEDLKLQGINITKEEENKIDKYEIIIRIDK